MSREFPPLLYLFAFGIALSPSVAAAEGAEESEPAPAASTSEPDITKYPVLKRFIEAIYPPQALADGRESAVALEIDISETGKVTRVLVTQGADATGYGFDEAAVAAVSQFEFEPAEAAGVPIAVTVTYKYRFVLKRAPPPESQETKQHVPVLSLRGRLLERGTRLPLAAVVVTIFQGEREAATGFEAISDAEGYFEFYDLAAGEWRILVELDGYHPVRTAESVAKDEVVEVTYYVERRSHNSFDVLVEGQRPRKEVTRRTIEREEIEAIPGSLGDPLSVVADMPGVAHMEQLGSTSDMFKGGGVIVRGSAPEDTLFAVNGIRVPYLYHFSSLRTAIPAGMLEYLEFQPGNFSPYYGRSTGGVLDARMKRLNPGKTGGYVDVSVLDTGLYLEAPLGKNGALAVGGRRSYIDAILNLVVSDDGPLLMTAAPRYYDFQILADYRPAPGQEISFFGIASDDRMAMVFSNPADADSIDVPGMGLSSRFYWGVLSHNWQAEKARNELKLGVGWNEDRYDFGGDKFVHRQRTNYQVVDTLSMKLRDGLVARCGLDVMAYDARYDVSFRRPRAEGEVGRDDLEGDGLRRTSFDGAWYLLSALFAEAEWTLPGGLLIVPGLRIDHFPSPTMQTTLDPRLTARWRLNDTITVKGAAGVYHQPPSIEQFDANFGNPALDAFWAYQYSAGGEYQVLPHVSVDMTLFYKDMRHMIGLSPKMVERGGETVPETYNNGARGRVYGVDLLIRHEATSNLFGWIAYTISRAERRDPGASEYRLFDYDQTHILTVLASYRLPRNWGLGARWRFVSGNPYTPYSGGVVDLDRDEYLPIAAGANSARLAPFHQLDLRMDKRWVFDAWMLSAYIDLQNVYARANVAERHYNYNFTKSRDESGVISSVPVFGLRAEF